MCCVFGKNDFICLICIEKFTEIFSLPFLRPHLHICGLIFLHNQVIVRNMFDGINTGCGRSVIHALSRYMLAFPPGLENHLKVKHHHASVSGMKAEQGCLRHIRCMYILLDIRYCNLGRWSQVHDVTISLWQSTIVHQSHSI